MQEVKPDLTKKWYMHNVESVLRSETNKLLWDFDKTDNKISARLPDLVIVNQKKRTYRAVNFGTPGDQSKTEKSEKKYKYLNLA